SVATPSEGVNKLADAIDSLDKSMQNHRYLIPGISDETYEHAQAESELQQLFRSRRINVVDYYGALQRLDDQYNVNAENVNDWGIDISEIGKKAAANIQDAFADFLFDPFKEGTDGMLKGFIDSVRKMIANAAAANLGRILFGNDKGESGILGDIFSSGGSKDPL